MPLFSRKAKAPTDPRPAIATFWTWWADNRDDLLRAADAGDTGAVADRLNRAVRALHGELDWELGEGRAARYTLTVSGGGRPELRGLAERWWRSAPPPDAAVEYSPTRQRAPDLGGRVLNIDDFELPLGEFVAGTRLERQRARFDVLVHHPLYPLLSDAARARACFLALDAALGEDDVERWVGTVEVAVDQPVDAIPLSGLAALADQLRPAALDSWATFQAQTRSGPLVGVVRHPFARIDRPLADTHVAVSLGYSGDESGMPVEPRIAEDIGGWEEKALAALGGDGPQVVLIGHETGLGRCVVHLYVDGLEVDAQQVRSIWPSWSHGAVSMQVNRDPAWREIGHLLS